MSARDLDHPIPWVRRLLLALGLILGSAPVGAGGPITVGFDAGGAVAGRQDIKVLQFNAAGDLLAWEHHDAVAVQGGPFAAATVTFWPPTMEDHSAFRLELDAWRAAATIDSAIAGRTRVEERRLALVASWLARAPLGDGGRDHCVYAAVGGGVVLSRISYGSSGAGPIFSAAAGFRTALGPRLAAHFEVRFMAAGDVDARHRDQLRLEVSGARRSRLSIEEWHMDAHFVPITVGLDWRL